MRLFSNLFNTIVFGSETEAVIKKLTKWEQEHFSSTGYRYNRQTGKSIISFRYTTYKNDAECAFNLSKIPLPFAENQDKKGIFNRFKDWVNPQPKPSLPALIAQYRNGVDKEIQAFRANVKRLDKLDSDLKRDSFFEETDRLFCNKLEVLYNELMFCKFDSLGEPNFFMKFTPSLHPYAMTLNH